jgi:uncharacterized membrane protein
MNWWQSLLTAYAAIFALVFFRVSILVNRKRVELLVTRGIKEDQSGHPLTYLSFLPDILKAASSWPVTVLWGGLYAFLRELM